MDSLAAMRAAARKLRDRTTAKLARFRREGINLAGTSRDPRSTLKAYQSMNRRQLASAIAKMTAFVSRETQFYRLSDGTTITGTEWKEFKAAESADHRAQRKRFNKIKDIVIAETNLTVEEFRAAHGANSNLIRDVGNPEKPLKRKPSMIANKEALKALKAHHKRNAVNGGQTNAERMMVDNFERLVGGIATSLGAQLKQLTPGQKYLLLMGTGFKEATKFNAYKDDTRSDEEREEHEAIANGRRPPAFVSNAQDDDAQILGANISKMQRLLKWASKQNV